MYNPVAMQVFNGSRKLKKQGFDFGGEKGFEHVLLESSEVVLDEIHDEEYTGLDNQLLLRSSPPFFAHMDLTHSYFLP